MVVYNSIKKNEYYDSVTLMVLSKKIAAISGVEEAAVMMGTDHNKELMFNSGILDSEKKKEASANDLIVGIKAENQDVIQEVLKVIESEFSEKKQGSTKGKENKFKNVEKAIEGVPDLNFAVVSIPGRFAKNEVMKCLRNNLNVLLFSDNVSYEDELQLKEYAREKKLLMMGPDCGTAIVNGVALGFANEMERGDIGLVGASGTGLQEVLSIIDHFNCGISQVLGTGGRDLKESIGAIMMLEGLEMLENDVNTNIIGIIAKASSRSSTLKLIERVKDFKKPVIACILGEDPKLFEGTNIEFIDNLQDTGIRVSSLSKKESLKLEKVEGIRKENNRKGKYLRALYSGGTLAYEAVLKMKDSLKDVYSNLEGEGVKILQNYEESQMHTILDMGDDYFTNGTPHPMIDPTLRSMRLKKEILDPETGVISLDCILGYGSHQDPAQEIISVIEEMRSKVEIPTVVVSLCGTKRDYQGYEKSVKTLEEAGIIVARTNVQAVEICLELLEVKDEQ